MPCTCPRDSGIDGICSSCANTVEYGLVEARLVDDYRPDRLMELMGEQAAIAWDLGVSLPPEHPFAKAA